MQVGQNCKLYHSIAEYWERQSSVEVKTQGLLWLGTNAASPAVVTHIEINAHVAKETVKARLNT